MSSEKLIKVCPACYSKDIVQDYEEITMQTIVGSRPRRDGSHCASCGVKFVYNCKPSGKDKING